MCEDCSGKRGSPRRSPGRQGGLSRRHFVVAGATGLASMAAFGSRSSASPMSPGVVHQPEILPRNMWAQGRAPKGEIPAEEPRFLLVHHTAEPGNGYAAADVPGLLQGIFDYHTGSAKGWPDVAYNFFIDRDGRIWEGRQGSLAGPVRGSATGGNQGWSQLCCFLGNFEAELPSEAAQRSMVTLLAWLADRYAIDTSPGATVTLESLGSNRWPAGETITTPTIAGHRDMSMTTCPGDAAYAWVTGALPEAVNALRLAQAPQATTSSVVSSSPTTAVRSDAAPGGPTTSGTVEPSSETGSPPSTEADAPARLAGPTRATDPSAPTGGMSWSTKVALGVGAAMAAGATAIGLGRARRERPQLVRHAGPHWTLSVSDAGDSEVAGSDDAGIHEAEDVVVGTAGKVAWVIHGGWPADSVEAALHELRESVGQRDLRASCAAMVRMLGPSPSGEGTVMLFLADTDENDSGSHLIGLGRGQISVRDAAGSRLLACPVDSRFGCGASFLVRLAEGATEVVVESSGSTDGHGITGVGSEKAGAGERG